MNALGVEVVIEDVSLHPKCAHGPTLLFERFTLQKKNSQRFYACSACRDRKDCPFFQLVDENGDCVSGIIKKLKTSEYFGNNCSIEDLTLRLKKVKKLKQDERVYCIECNKFVLKDETKCINEHKLTKNLSHDDFKNPSNILTPMTNPRKEAQFFFSKKTVEFLYNTILNKGYKKVVCIGCPRLHEYILYQPKSVLKSFLMDIDFRFENFFNPQQFCHYNIFNHYFFRQDKQHYNNFLSSERLLLVMDPPFGGLVDVLSNSVKLISKDWRVINNNKNGAELLDIFWFFPYFLEKRISECLPLKMLDYQVDYDNHPLFKKGTNSSVRKSPVRIFTNVNRSEIQLPVEDGYKFCKLCNRFVSEENTHCPKCNDCTSKDGHRYNHCDSCNRCVKHTKHHCNKCKNCFPLDHICQTSPKIIGCHICGDISHKRKECPSRNGKKNKTPRGKKRSQNVNFSR